VDGENEAPQHELDGADNNAADDNDPKITPNDKTEEEAVLQPEPDPVEPCVEVKTVHDVAEVNEEPAQAPVVPAPAPEPTAAPEEIPGVRRSTRVKFQMKPGHAPCMAGSSACLCCDPIGQ
jgi:hypothetical protein